MKELKNLHKNYTEGNLILRDYLAAHRTVLANDRSLLASTRTSLTLFVAGVTFIKFFDSQILSIVGWTFIPVGVALFIVGIWRYYHMQKLIHSIKNDEDRIKDGI